MALHRPARGLVHPARALAGLALILLVGLAIAATASANASSTANTFGQDMFGISTGGAIQGEDPTTLGRDLDAIQTVGSRWVRIDINWANIQAGGPSSYNWGPIDRVVQGATSRGMKVLGVILYTPSWARPSGTSGTYGPNPGQYAAFASTAVQHYSAMGVHSYEVWNEPNIPAFWTAPNPSAYTALLKAAYPAIKGADPQATVLTGGTAPATTNGTSYAPVDWLQAIYANGGKGYFDAVATHPYCMPAFPGDPDPSSAWYQIYGTNPSLRSVMLANGDGAKKIWGTEFGAPTKSPWSVSEAAQAQMITTAYSLWSTYDWAGPLFTYEGRDLGTDTSDPENFFGLLRHDFSQKPAYPAYQAAASGVAPANTAPPEISGTAQDAQTLSASKGSWSGSPGVYAYQWRRCDTSGAGCASISGATTSSYRLVSGDVGSTIRVIVTATNPAGSSSASSDQTAVVAAAQSAPANTAPPEISGTAQDAQTLSASKGSWSGSPGVYAYQWRRCDTSGAGCASISGATTSSYRLVSGDVGSTIRVIVTATNPAGSSSASSDQTAVVAAAQSAPANTAPPEISGTAQDAQTLSASKGSWSGSPGVYAYQWRRCDTSGAGCASISGATTSSYRLVSGDVGSTIRVIVTATNPAGSSSASSDQTAVVAAATTVTVTGRGGKHPKAMGVVSAQSTSGAGNSGTMSGKVELTLYQRSGASWQPVSPLETARLNVRGRFQKPLRAFRQPGTAQLDARSPASGQRPLRAGTYRLYARYPGSRTMKPSSCRSARFTLDA